MESSLGGAAVMKAGNDFLSRVTALGKVYCLIQIKIQILRQVLANSLVSTRARAALCSCQASSGAILSSEPGGRPVLLITVEAGSSTEANSSWSYSIVANSAVSVDWQATICQSVCRAPRGKHKNGFKCSASDALRKPTAQQNKLVADHDRPDIRQNPPLDCRKPRSDARPARVVRNLQSSGRAATRHRLDRSDA